MSESAVWRFLPGGRLRALPYVVPTCSLDRSLTRFAAAAAARAWKSESTAKKGQAHVRYLEVAAS